MNKTTAQALGEAIRAARRAEGLSQETLAALGGISERTLRDIETGRGSPSLRAVIAVSAVLGLTVRACP
ncbi:helix-turn-helix transcriptional regulator [Arthrobacter sp. UM1]|uniref:helix-turn-helix transcriptional regulator n=1 Tax=Arthrobacter sp. UM1 TaxID=2766776 RepID=UPI001CF6AB99|nr:helix-turn-helix transcriptional regulator [Arthrobacter sp. UM1]MCB4207387.1 helix-turn-helix transcriptional regulator [Arthrobacter sp. UM1]